MQQIDIDTEEKVEMKSSNAVIVKKSRKSGNSDAAKVTHSCRFLLPMAGQLPSPFSKMCVRHAKESVMHMGNQGKV